MSTHLTPTQEVTEHPPELAPARWLVAASHTGATESPAEFVVEATGAAEAFIKASLLFLGSDIIEDQFVGQVHGGRYNRVAVRGPIKPGTAREVETLTLREQAEAAAEVARRRRERSLAKRREDDLRRNRANLTQQIDQVFGSGARFDLELREVWGRERFVALLRWDDATTLELIAREDVNNRYDARLAIIELCPRCQWHAMGGSLERLTDALRELEEPLLGRHRCDAERLEQIAEEARRAQSPPPFWRMEEVSITDGLCFRFTNRHGDSFDLDNQRHPYLSRVGDELRVTAQSILVALNAIAEGQEDFWPPRAETGGPS